MSIVSYYRKIAFYNNITLYQMIEAWSIQYDKG